MFFLSKMVYLDVKYMTASRNYEFLNTGNRLNADHFIDVYYFELHYYTHFRTSKNNNK